MEIIALIIACVSGVAAVWSAIIAVRATRYARDSVTASILLELIERYSTKEMNDAVHYLWQLRRDHASELEENPYAFARRYLATVSPDSPEWQMRRKVAHFYNHVAALLEEGLIDENAVFSRWGTNDIAIIEFLEPIQVAITEKYNALPYYDEWPALRLLHRGQRWQKKRQRKTDSRFTLPRNAELYAQSLQEPDETK